MIFLWLLLSFQFVVGAGPVCADIYRYVDKHGVIHFSNVPTDYRYRLFLSSTRISFKAYINRFDGIIRRAAHQHGVDSSLVKAVIRAESDFDQKAVSKKGAQGLMQLMPETAKALEVKDSFDPHQNIKAGVRYLKKQLDDFENNVPLALAAYNAGPNAVRKYGNIPPYKETRTFVNRVLHYWDEFKYHRRGRP
jgi:soluble lytic murein transglycosylase